MVYTDIFISLGNNIKKDGKQTLSGVKITYRLDQIVQEPGNCILYYLQDRSDRDFVLEDLMHISEDTQVLPDWVSEWK